MIISTYKVSYRYTDDECGMSQWWNSHSEHMFQEPRREGGLWRNSAQGNNSRKGGKKGYVALGFVRLVRSLIRPQLYFFAGHVFCNGDEVLHGRGVGFEHWH